MNPAPVTEDEWLFMFSRGHYPECAPLALHVLHGVTNELELLYAAACGDHPAMDEILKKGITQVRDRAQLGLEIAEKQLGFGQPEAEEDEVTP